MPRARAELLRFLVVGLTTVLIDWLVYHLTMTLGVGIGIAKAIGFLSGTVFAFFVNRAWTFGVVEKGNPAEIWRFLLLYGTTLIVNVAINSAVLAVADNSRFAFLCAFVSATGVSAALNFIGMKFFVFPSAVSQSQS